MLKRADKLLNQIYVLFDYSKELLKIFFECLSKDPQD
jgi:hypothetical protein